MMIMPIFTIIENYVPKDEINKIAKAVLRSQELLEQTWDEKEEEYSRTIMDCVEEAVKEIGLVNFQLWTTSINEWNNKKWNDCNQWASEIIKKQNVTLPDTKDVIDNNKANELLSLALRAICLTRDYVGEDLLPAIEGWEWYDAGKKISEIIPLDEWSIEFRKRVNGWLSKDIREIFKVGDYVFGLGEFKGCSQVFEGVLGDYQPFSYLNDFNPENYRLATKEEYDSLQLTW